MNHAIENRRDFLRNALISAAALPMLASCKTSIFAQKTSGSELSLVKKNAITDPSCNWCGAKDAPDNVGWKTRFGEENVKGERMLISGTVFQADGRTPAPDILIYAYHTDSEGYYGRNGEVRHGRFRGWMLTDANGRYEFSSIKPAPYPNNTNPAHIHFTITGKNLKEDWIDSVWFEGDKFVTPEAVKKQLTGRGGFNPIVKLERDGNDILRGVRNIQLA